MKKDLSEPFALFAQWLEEAGKTEPNDPNAMALASIGPEGMPSVRMVLLKGHDERGFVFYTNYESQKGRELLAHPKAGLCWHWKSLRRQIRAEGAVETLSAEEADAYFATRAKASQIGAWASLQSRPIPSPFAFERRIAEFTAKYALGPVPRPPYWSGFLLRPTKLEFWQDKPFRLHDRLVYHRQGDGWITEKLYP